MGTPGMESVSTEPELRNYQSAAGDWKATPTQRMEKAAKKTGEDESTVEKLLEQAGVDGSIQVSCSPQKPLKEQASPAPESAFTAARARALLLCEEATAESVMTARAPLGSGVTADAAAVTATDTPVTAGAPATDQHTTGTPIKLSSCQVAAGPVVAARQAAMRGAVGRRRGAARAAVTAAVLASSAVHVSVAGEAGSAQGAGPDAVPAEPTVPAGSSGSPLVTAAETVTISSSSTVSLTQVSMEPPAGSAPAPATGTTGHRNSNAHTAAATGTDQRGIGAGSGLQLHMATAGLAQPAAAVAVDVTGNAHSTLQASGLFDNEPGGAGGDGWGTLFRPLWGRQGVGAAGGGASAGSCTVPDCRGCSLKDEGTLVSRALAAAAATTAAADRGGRLDAARGEDVRSAALPPLPVSIPAAHGSGGGAHGSATSAHAAAMAYHAAQAVPQQPYHLDLSGHGVRSAVGAERGAWSGAAAAAAPAAATTTRIHADGICCPAEVGLIHTVLRALPGVELVDVHVVTKAVVVRHDARSTPAAALLSALNAVEMKATLASAAGPRRLPAEGDGWALPPTGVLASCLFLAVALCSYLPGLPSQARQLRWAALGAVAVGAPPIVRKAVAALRTLTLDINALMVLAVAGALALGEVVEAGAIVVLFGGAEWVEDRCLARARATIGAVLSMQPETALLLDEGSGAAAGDRAAAPSSKEMAPEGAPAVTQPPASGAQSSGDVESSASSGRGVLQGCASEPAGTGSGPNASSTLGSTLGSAPQAASAGTRHPRAVAVEEVCVGALVLVRPGDRIPLDGTIEAGCSAADEALLTGEARPVAKGPGDLVVGGSTNVGTASLTVRVSAAAADSTVARLGGLMEAGAAAKSRRDRAVEVFARTYTPTIAAAALITAIVPPLVTGGGWGSWAYLSLVLLVSACPCALVISTPVTSVCGLARAAQQGVVAKGSRQLEALGRVRVVTLDKSGTLTEGRFAVAHAEVFHMHSTPTHTAQAASSMPVAGADQLMSDSHLTAASGYGSGQQLGVDLLAAGDGMQQQLLQTAPRMPLPRMLSLVAAVEAGSAHPVAGALVAHAAAQAGYEMLHAEGVEVLPGEGIKGHVGGHEVVVCSGRAARAALRRAAAASPQGTLQPAHAQERHVHLPPLAITAAAQDFAAGDGRLSLMQPQGVSSGENQRGCREAASAAADAERVAAALRSWGPVGATVVFVLVDGELIGYLAVADQVRPGAKEAVAALRQRGVMCAMLTGDERRAAGVVGAAVGLDPAHVHAELLPQDKLALVLAYRRQSPALFPERGSGRALAGFGAAQYGRSGTGGWLRMRWLVGRGTYRRPTACSSAGGGQQGSSGGSDVATTVPVTERLLPAGMPLSSSSDWGSSASGACGKGGQQPWWRRMLRAGSSSSSVSQASQLELPSGPRQAVRMTPSLEDGAPQPPPTAMLIDMREPRSDQGGGSSSQGGARNSMSFGGWLGSFGDSRRARNSISLGGLSNQKEHNVHESACARENSMEEGSNEAVAQGGAAAAAWLALGQTRPRFGKRVSGGGGSSAGGASSGGGMHPAGLAGAGSGGGAGGVFAWRNLRKRGGRATHGSYGGGASGGGAGSAQQQQGHGWGRASYVGVAHVGDGVNDAPALAAADVGIALGCGGAALAVEAADVALFGGDLRALAFARDLGSHVSRVITINIVFALAVKVTVIALAFAGHVSLWAGVAADVGSAVAVVLHGLSVLAFRRGSKSHAGYDESNQSSLTSGSCGPSGFVSGGKGSNGLPAQTAGQKERDGVEAVGHTNAKGEPSAEYTLHIGSVATAGDSVERPHGERSKQDAASMQQPLLPAGVPLSDDWPSHEAPMEGPSFPIPIPAQAAAPLSTHPWWWRSKTTNFEFSRHTAAPAPTPTASPTSTSSPTAAPTAAACAATPVLLENPTLEVAQQAGEGPEVDRFSDDGSQAALAPAAAARRRGPRAAARGGAGSACPPGCPCAAHLGSGDGERVEGSWGTTPSGADLLTGTHGEWDGHV